MLFEKLMHVMGADQYLWRLILLYIESVTARSTVTKQGAMEERDAVVTAMWPGIEEEKVRQLGLSF